jgi:hypothetical protein
MGQRPCRTYGPSPRSEQNILRFVEQNFGISEGALNFADQRATNDLTSFFNLNTSPRTFNVIPAPRGEEFFLNDKRPMEPPDTD